MARLHVVVLISMALLCYICTSTASVFTGTVNTDDGYCDIQGFGRIAVGERGYDDDKCLRATCHEGFFEGEGCGVMTVDIPGCRLVSRPGHYPRCCPHHLECDEGVNTDD